jgi:hypothetical protein
MLKKAAAFLLALTVAGCSSGQSGGDTAPAPTGSTILTHTFSSSRGEYVRVFLASGTTYEAELDGGGIQLQVRPVDAGVQSPRVEEKTPGVSAGGSSIFTVQPKADGEYEFRTLRGDPGRPLTLRIRIMPPRGQD